MISVKGSHCDDSWMTLANPLAGTGITGKLVNTNSTILCELLLTNGLTVWNNVTDLIFFSPLTHSFLQHMNKPNRRIFQSKATLVKLKAHPSTGNEGPKEEYRCSSTLTLTSGLDGVGGQRHAPAALLLGMTRYSSYRRLGGSQSRSIGVRKISPPPPPPGFDPGPSSP